jgi:hypothetical protein
VEDWYGLSSDLEATRNGTTYWLSDILLLPLAYRIDTRERESDRVVISTVRMHIIGLLNIESTDRVDRAISGTDYFVWCLHTTLRM